MHYLISIFNSIIINQFRKGHERSIMAKKNILALLIFKGLSICISLILVPLTINYINPSRYGIWLTMSSIVGWFGFFDIGLTQGLRNKFAEAKAKKDDSLVQIYVSTTYAILSLIFSCIWALFILVNRFLNWPTILNVSVNMAREVNILAVIVFTYFCLNFVLRIITSLLTADQKPAISSFVELVGQVIALISVVILAKTFEGSLIKLAFALCASPILVMVFTNLILFKGAYNKYRPTISQVKFSYASDLFNLGLIFFIIQVAGIIQYQTANVIIAQNFGTSEVTSYNIVYKYFGVLSMIFTIFLIPFWSASTEAYNKNEIQWIRNGIHRYNQLNIFLLIMAIIMLVFSDTIYRLWIGEGKVNIEFSLSLWGFIFYNVSMFGGKYVSFLNGISALRIQFFASVISPFLYIALALLLIKQYNMGVYSLFIASIAANFNGFLLAPFQYYMIVVKKKRGIWVK